MNEKEFEYIQKEWELDDKEKENFHLLRKSAFNYMIEVVRKYNFFDKYVLNENNINEFVKIKNEKTLEI